MADAVTVHDLHKNFAGEHALAGVSFNVGEGCLFGLIGADGAGKTTLLRILTTLGEFDKGSVSVLGKDAVKNFKALRLILGYMPQKFSLYQDLSVRENILFFADIFGVGPAQRLERMNRLLSFSRLSNFQNRRARDLSGGMKQKLALSCALIHTPKILVLDEPTTGVDPVSRREFWNILFDLKKQGTTIIVSTPYMDEAQQCDELLFLHHGKIIRHGNPETILAQYPYALFSGEGAGGTMLFHPGSGKTPQGIELMYPAQGSLHIATELQNFSEGDVLLKIKSVVPEAESIRKINPNIEDLFIYLLSKSN
ncbi:MAG TPA: ABC transporter ATP-binding protein [Chitinivibrionales bacterium]